MQQRSRSGNEDETVAVAGEAARNQPQSIFDGSDPAVEAQAAGVHGKAGLRKCFGTAGRFGQGFGHSSNRFLGLGYGVQGVERGEKVFSQLFVVLAGFGG